MNLEQIDTSTTAGKAEVMRLAAEGRRVAMRSQPGAQPMNVADVNLYPWVYSAGVHPSWNWTQCDYAIISEPVGPDEVWMTVINGCVDAGPYTFEFNAVRRAQDYGGEVVKYIRADLAGENG